MIKENNQTLCYLLLTSIVQYNSQLQQLIIYLMTELKMTIIPYVPLLMGYLIMISKL